MKKYFTKLIAVEGKIFEGDIVMGTNGVCVIWGNESRHGLQYYGWEESIQYLKTPRKAKLFLCSRDIQVGDMSNLGEIYRIEGDDVSVWDKTDGMSLLATRKECFKPIREISPDATWVTENQELDESEVGILYNFVGEDSDDELFTLEEFPKAVRKWFKNNRTTAKMVIDRTPIAVKCPTCKSYH